MFGSGERFSIVAALSEVPLEHVTNDDGRTTISAIDLVAATDAAGIAKPAGSTDHDRINDWLVGVAGVDGAGVTVVMPQTFRDATRSHPDYIDELGFSPADADAVIESDAAPVRLTVLAGVNLELADGTETEGGIVSFGDGDDHELHPESRSIARPLGRPLRAAVDAERVILSSSTAAVVAWQDANSARASSDPGLMQAAEALDELDVFAAFVANDSFGIQGTPEGIVPLTTPFQTLGIGWLRPSDSSDAVVVYVSENPTAATALAAEVRDSFGGLSVATGQPLAELVVVTGVTTQGAVSIVTVDVLADRRGPVRLFDMMLRGEAPFLYNSS